MYIVSHWSMFVYMKWTKVPWWNRYCNFPCFHTGKNDNQDNPDYIPTVKRDYAVRTPANSMERYQRAVCRDEDRTNHAKRRLTFDNENSAAEALMDLSNPSTVTNQVMEKSSNNCHTVLYIFIFYLSGWIHHNM